MITGLMLQNDGGRQAQTGWHHYRFTIDLAFCQFQLSYQA
jgi:hypothetical protein